MKKSIILSGLAIFTLSIFISACSKDSNNTTTTSTDDTTNKATQGTWVAKATMPTGTASAINYGRNGSVSFVINGNAYVGAGYTTDPTNLQVSDLDDFWKYDPTSNSWTQLSTLVGPGRSYAYTFTINNLGFIGGGYASQSDTYLNDLYSYNPDNNTWTSRAKNTNLTSGLYKCYSFALNNYGYVGGGRDRNQTSQSAVYQYNPSNNTWTTTSSFPGDKKASAMTFVYNNKAYVVGGETGGVVSYDFYSFDGTNWSELSLTRDATSESFDDKYTNIARSSASAFVLNNWAYIVGGETNGVANASTWSYDIANDRWYANTAFPIDNNNNIGKLVGGTGFSINNKGYFLTGIATGTSNTYSSSSNFYEFDAQ